MNTELKEGYLPLIRTTEGVLVGEAAVTNTNRFCRVLAINATEEDLNIEIPPQELIHFGYYNVPGEDSDEYFLNGNLIRWRLKLQDCEYTLKYKTGKLNINADALCPNPIQNNATTLKEIEELPSKNNADVHSTI